MSHERALPSGLRSYLFAPGNHPRKVAKVFAAGADAVLLDLEDAVPIAEKESTRAAVVEAMRAPRAVRGYIRVNGLETAWCADDIACVVGHGVDGIVLPKIESAEQVRAAAAFIAMNIKSYLDPCAVGPCTSISCHHMAQASGSVVCCSKSSARI